MAFVLPKFSKGEVNRAGDILRSDRPLWSDGQGLDHIAYREQMWANTVLANWRGIHTYPINTFQATLRLKLRDIDSEAIVAQRLKRAPSIVLKLQRFEGMKLARMQDIGGLRAIVGTMGKVRRLEKAYRTTRFAHELISSKDYIREPKPDGYRGIHLIYRNKNNGAPAYNGLSIEMQFRTRLQHAWATAVETMGTFLGQALKSGQGDESWRNFFGIAGAALAVVEKTQAVPGYENRSLDEIGHQLAEAESRLRVIEKLRGFAVATNQIHTQSGPGAYHLIVLDSTVRRQGH
jgi:putative GTP pyrophosphokinase